MTPEGGGEPTPGAGGRSAGAASGRGSTVRTVAVAVLAVGVVLAVAFVLFGGSTGPEPPATAPRSEAGHSAPTPQPRARIAPAAPTRLVIPAIGLRAPVLPIEVNPDGVLHPPDDVDKVGWWQRSAKPGARRGQTVLTGHTVSSGGGVMDDLGELTRGDRVRVVSPEGTVVYRTTRVRDYSTEEVAAQARRLFGQDRRHGRLVLVTCTDWDGEVYRSNTIAFAAPVGARPASARS